MKVALYARVSTSDKDQNPETQLLPLQEFVAAQGWSISREYVDQAPATDLLRRVQWRQLLDEDSKRRFDLVLVCRMDRAFRSVLDADTTLERLRSYSEPWLDTTSPFREALYYITIAYAQLERGFFGSGSRPGWSEPEDRAESSVGPRPPSGLASRSVLELFWSASSREIFQGVRPLKS
jgi:DNA invertase Pin-like site-specific DNA recombinase